MTLKLITPPAESITLADAKLHCRITTSADDALVADLITAAREQAEHELGRGLGAQTWQLALDAFPTAAIDLVMPPVSSINAVLYVDSAGVQQTLAAEAYTLDAESDLEAWLLPAEGYTWPATLDTANAVKVTFTTGLATVPAPVRQWMLVRIGTLYAVRQGLVAGQISDLPNAYVDRLLDRYRVPSA
jgi:uncharacterized phiE125 gp8 family phage protein